MSPTLRLKLGLLALLLVNALVFLVRGEFNDSFDSLAWILLMLLYEFETGRLVGFQSIKRHFPWIRNLAVVVVVLAELSYLFEEAWLDGVYSLLWLMVVALFEVESRYPRQIVDHPQLFRAAGAGLILGMMGVIGAWIFEQSYFNAYDGLIWSLAFLIIDLDLMASALQPISINRRNSSLD